MKDIKVVINNKQVIVKSGTTVADLLADNPHVSKFPALGAIINGRLDGLYYELKSDADVRTIDLSSREGMDIYRRTASILLFATIKEIFPQARLSVGQSLSDGYFFEVHDHLLDPVFFKSVAEKMHELVAKDLLIEPVIATIEEAVAVLQAEGQSDQVELLKQSRLSETQIIKFNGYRGCIFGPIANKSGLIDRFAIYPYEHGLVLAFPDERGVVPSSIPSQPKLFSTYLETKRWNALMRVENVAQLNRHCIDGTISDIVKVAEALHERKIAEIADDIVRRKDSRVILIAGPSCSGKTTFMKRLAIQLKLLGIEAVPISLDNYYLDRDDTPKHPDGSFNFEAFEALDVNLLNEHIPALLRGEEVLIPSYSFPLGTRAQGKGTKFRLLKNQVIIFEGIHGLNEALTPCVPPEHKYRIFVSALTQLCLDEHNRIFTTDSRLIRRMVRDRLFRNTGAADTIAGWHSVRSGENSYIFPHQEKADAIFNSALVYEHALLKPYAERSLMEVQREHSSFMESVRLFRFFSYFIPILSREVPYQSILREFIGGSTFKY